MVWYSHLFKNFPQFIVIHTVRGSGRVNKAEIDVFLELSCFFDDPGDVGNLISDSSAFSKTSLNIWKFTVHVTMKMATEDEMVGWRHQLNRHEFEQASGDGEGQGSLVWCSPWGHKELDTT